MMTVVKELKKAKSRSSKGRFAHRQSSFVRPFPFLFFSGRSSFRAARKHTLNEIKSQRMLGNLFSSQDFCGKATPVPVSPVTTLLGVMAVCHKALAAF